MGSERGQVRSGHILEPRMKAEVRAAAASTKHPGSSLQGLEGARHPTHPPWGFALGVGPACGRGWNLSTWDSPFRQCLGLWNNRWCFYNLSEACSWVDSERQYLRTTGLQEVVKLLLPIYILFFFFWQCFHWGVFPLSFLFFFFFNFMFILLLWQSVSLYFFFSLLHPSHPPLFTLTYQTVSLISCWRGGIKWVTGPPI